MNSIFQHSRFLPGAGLIRTVIAVSALMLSLAAGHGASAQELVILHTNDTHSHIDPVKSGDEAGLGGVIERAAYIDSVRAAVGKKNLLLLDAGDFSQGTSYFTLLGGDLEVRLLNEMRYDVACLGNHEFDNGIDDLARRLRKARFKVLCANYDFSGSALSKVVRPYAVVRRAGMKIGIVGVLPDVRAVVDKHIAVDLKYTDHIAAANRYAALLKDKGCDLVIVLSHLGLESDISYAALSRNVDLIVGGHSHTFLEDKLVVEDADGKEVAVTTDGCWGLYVGKITVY